MHDYDQEGLTVSRECGSPLEGVKVLKTKKACQPIQSSDSPGIGVAAVNCEVFVKCDTYLRILKCKDFQIDVKFSER